MNKAVAHPSFEQLQTRRIESLDIDITEYRHTKTGTPHFHLAADNTENVFLVGLRTVPQDSTGVAHILEHTVLCGSEKYPVRDPFFMMIRRSLNTFMNAFTSTDWTAYPFATQNRKDYFNLLDVYLDAVFFSRLDELDFAQEGHRMEFAEAENPDSDLTFKGVVFNEMKGAMSSPVSTLWQTLTKHMFPNNTYHYNSGGDPEAIPDLSYAELKAFYDTHYHPSNAVFMTYGDIPAEELQERFDSHVLQRFDPLDTEISVSKTQRYYAPLRIEEAYALQEEDTSDKTHVVVAWLLGESTSLEDRLRSHLLSNVLLDNSASPLLQALETSSLGKSPSPLCGLEDSNQEMLFVCGLEGCKVEDADAIEQMILEVLQDIADNGVPQEQVDAVMHQLEFSQREIRGDGMPFGLQLVLGGLSTAMLRGDTMSALDLDPALEQLHKDSRDPDYLRHAARDLLISNPHRVRLSLRPDTQLSELRQQAELARLAETKDGLDAAAKQQLVERAKQLAARQLQEDDAEILPKVGLEDVPAELPIATGTTGTVGDTEATFFATGTNGIVYHDVLLQMPHLDDDLLELLPYYTSFLSELGSGGRDYLQTQGLQAQITGSFRAYATHRGALDNADNILSYFVLSGKSLLRNQSAMASLMAETLESARFDEHTRLRELFAQTRSGREQSITGSGHSLAMSAAASGISNIAALSHELHGLAGIQRLKTLDDSLNQADALAEVASRLQRLHDTITNAPRQHLVISEGEHHDDIAAAAASAFDKLSPANGFKALNSDTQNSANGEPVRQLWTTSTEVNFAARADAAVPASHDDAAALAVLGPYLRNGFLHRAIRETGGAYGGGATYESDSASFRFYSYRDPRLTETFADFDASVEWLLAEKPDARGVEEAILNIISRIDKPGSPAGDARSSFQSTLFGRSPELRQRMRAKILKVSGGDLQRVGKTYLSGSTPSLAAVTNQAGVAACAGMSMQQFEI